MIKNEIDILEPYEGEIFYSWLSRMFWWYGYLINSSNNIHKFNCRLFGYDSKTITNILIPYNLKTMVDIFNMPESQYFKSADDVIFNISIVPFYTAFISDNNRIKVYNHLYTNNNVKSLRAILGLNEVYTYSIKNYQFKFCYHCWEENGNGYFHREHQIIGNNMCFKHKTSLQYIKGNSNNYFVFNNINIHNLKDYKPCTSTNFEINLLISIMIHDIFENGFKDNILTLKSKLRKAMIKSGYLNSNFNYFENIEHFFKMFRRFNILDIKSKELVSALFSTTTIPNPIIYLTLILFLYGTIKACYEYPIDDFEIKELTYHIYNSKTKVKPIVKGTGIIYYKEIIKKRKDNDYIIIEKVYRGHRAHYKIKHESCGHIWISPQKQIYDMNEILCPQCRAYKKEQDIINNRKLMVDRVNSEYEFIGICSNYWRIKHKPCGKTFLTSPNKFLDGKKTCNKCNRKKYIGKIIDDFNNYFKGEFEIIEFKRSDKKSIILHNDACCKGEFSTLIRNFYYRKTCPSCNKPKQFKYKRYTRKLI